MKKMAIFFVAAAMTLSLAACGSRGNNSADSTVTDRYDEGYDKGYQDGYDDAKREMEAALEETGPENNGDAGANGDMAAGGEVAGDMQNAVDDVGDAVGDVGDAVGDMVTGNSANATGFQRMLDNARVHDSDGDLNDGENSTR